MHKPLQVWVGEREKQNSQDPLECVSIVKKTWGGREGGRERTVCEQTHTAHLDVC